MIASCHWLRVCVNLANDVADWRDMKSGWLFVDCCESLPPMRTCSVAEDFLDCLHAGLTSSAY